MSEIDSQVIELMQKANMLKVQLSLEQGSLVVKYSKGKKIDPGFVNELKDKKGKLIEYLTTLDQEQKPKMFFYEGKELYPISNNHLYWVDEDDKEFKEKMYILFCYRITGAFQVDVFTRAIEYLVRRHEDLRATFHHVGGRYYAYFEEPDSPKFRMEFLDIRDGAVSEESPEHPLNFPHHEFDLANGPLFLVRLMQSGENEYILSAKFHHSIFDGWSISVFKRDLYMAYVGLLSGKEPQLPMLDRQLRDFMSDANHFSDKYADRDRKFWSSLYKSLPGLLVIPGAIERESIVNCRPSKSAEFPISPELMKQISALAGRFRVSIFIMLQSLVKGFVAHISGQRDLVIGIQSFAREEYPGSEEQLGFYSRMLFVRTILDKEDRLVDIVEKVKVSNENTQNHKAYSLIDFMSEEISAKPGMVNSFWKINIDFSDSSGFYAEIPKGDGKSSDTPLIFQSLPESGRNEMPTDIELKMHFYWIENNARLDLNYDSGIYNADSIQVFGQGLLAFFREITKME